MNLAKDIARPIWRILKDKDERAFRFEEILHGYKPRFTSISTRLGKCLIEAPDSKSYLSQVKEIFVEKAYQFNSRTDNPVIFDVGANIGLASIYFATHYKKPRIICFEPDPALFSLLSKNIERNKAEADISLINAAAWVDDTRLEFDHDGSDGGRVTSSTNSRTISVIAKDLNSYLEQYDKIDLLKMDIEGAEFTVLPHIQKNLHRVDNLFLEVHIEQSRKNAHEILKIIEDAGFTYYMQTIQSIHAPFCAWLGNRSSSMLQFNLWASRGGA